MLAKWNVDILLFNPANLLRIKYKAKYHAFLCTSASRHERRRCLHVAKVYGAVTVNILRQSIWRRDVYTWRHVIWRLVGVYICNSNFQGLNVKKFYRKD